MADVQFIDPKSQTPTIFDPAQASKIARRRKIAEAMMKSGQQQNGTEVISGVAVKQSPLAALAKAMQQGVGAYQDKKADTEETAQKQASLQRMAEAIRSGNTTSLESGSPEEQSLALKHKWDMQEAALKAANGQNTPSPIQITQEVEKRLKAGDVQGANLLLQVAKTYDKGINPFAAPDSTSPVVSGSIPAPPALAPQPINGYGGAVGDVKGTIKGAEQNAKNQSDLNYANPTAQAIAIGKATGEAKGAYAKKDMQADDNNLVIQNILQKDQSGRDILDKATGSGIGSVVAAGKGFVGKSDESTQANSQLAIYGGQLLNNVPRMEGPQSDADVRSYKEQAGKIADPKIPAGDKRAALQAIQQLKSKYAAMNVMPNQTPQGPVDYKSKYGLQ